MDISNKHQLNLFVIWLIIVLPSLFFAFTYFPSRELDWLNLSLLLTILFVTMLLPLQIKEVDIPLDKWVTITVFLQYGVWAELVLMQIAIVILIMTSKSTTPKLYRLLFNSLIFVIVSIASGFVFHIAGGEMGSLDFSHVVFYGLLYAATYTVLNNLLLKLYFFVCGRQFSLVSRGAVADYVVTFTLLPIAISVYFLQENIGIKSVFLLGVPFIVLLFIARSYIKSNNLNERLAEASKIGHELTEQHRFDEVVASFITNLKEVIPYQNAYVIDIKNEKAMYFLMGYHNNYTSKQNNSISVEPEYHVESGLNKDVTKIYDNQKELEELQAIQLSETIESVMTVPIKREEKTEGFLLLTSKRKNVFQPLDVKIINILAGYFMISLDKAIQFEETINASEHCALTKLYNFEYLEKKLEEQVIQFHTGEIKNLSLILLDIDHFKHVNDTYGHENGNFILAELAKILTKHSGINDTVARYGGEEFVFLIANNTREGAVERAERLRETVERTVFTIIPDLGEDKSPIDIHITISLGIATIPEDANAVQELLRNADRALYIGGKQAGRNRVGVFGQQ